MKGVTNREVNELVEVATAAGWTAETSRGGHVKLMAPHGALVWTPKTGSDRRGWLNLRARLRREGLEC